MSTSSRRPAHTPGATNPYTPKTDAVARPPTLAQFEARRRQQLDALIRETRHNQQVFTQLQAETRCAQLRKARNLTETNPLKYDNSQCYTRTIAKITRNFVRNSH